MTNEKRIDGGTSLTEGDAVSVSVPADAAPHAVPVVIELDPAVWMRGTAYGKLLRVENGVRQQCCLGIALTALGKPDYALLDQAELQDARPLPKIIAPLSRHGLSSDERCSDIYSINDDADVDDAERVHLINKELDRLNASIRFTLKSETATETVSEASGSVPSAAQKSEAAS